MRIAKYMADCGVASRRKSEELIALGDVPVNGKRITEPGTDIDPEKDEVKVNGRVVKFSGKKIYVMLNKPVGCVSTCYDDKGRTTVLDYVSDIKERIYPIGRLDFTTEGLLLLTNDGELANILTHPRNEVPKRYLVIISGTLTREEADKLEKGVMLEDGKTAPARVKLLKTGGGKTEFTVIIHEGRNHEVKRMLESLGKKVIFLKRISVGDINLGKLKRGTYRYLTDEEVAYLKSLGR